MGGRVRGKEGRVEKAERERKRKRERCQNTASLLLPPPRTFQREQLRPD
jgi:hypothetical protein